MTSSAGAPLHDLSSSKPRPVPPNAIGLLSQFPVAPSFPACDPARGYGIHVTYHRQRVYRFPLDLHYKTFGVPNPMPLATGVSADKCRLWLEADYRKSHPINVLESSLLHPPGSPIRLSTVELRALKILGNTRDPPGCHTGSPQESFKSRVRQKHAGRWLVSRLQTTPTEGSGRFTVDQTHYRQHRNGPTALQ